MPNRDPPKTEKINREDIAKEEERQSLEKKLNGAIYKEGFSNSEPFIKNAKSHLFGCGLTEVLDYDTHNNSISGAAEYVLDIDGTYLYLQTSLLSKTSYGARLLRYLIKGRAGIEQLAGRLDNTQSSQYAKNGVPKPPVSRTFAYSQEKRFLALGEKFLEEKGYKELPLQESKKEFNIDDRRLSAIQDQRVFTKQFNGQYVYVSMVGHTTDRGTPFDERSHTPDQRYIKFTVLGPNEVVGKVLTELKAAAPPTKVNGNSGGTVYRR
ncbi:hypothetical protein ACFLZX_06350 [Nanoarchaeota archaeon]